MEEMICRGKRLDNEAWLEGYYVHLKGTYKGRESHRIYTGHAEIDCDDFYPDWDEIDPETLGRHTGLQDKNGKSIFEGDVLSVGTVKGIVEWSQKECAFVFERKNFDRHRKDFFKICILTRFGDFDQLEIIGNIHDNPEML